MPPRATTLCVINHAGFVASYKVKNSRTGKIAESGHFPIDQTRCTHLGNGVGGAAEVGDEFSASVTAVLGRAEGVNRGVEFAPNNLTATFESRGQRWIFFVLCLGRDRFRVNIENGNHRSVVCGTLEAGEAPTVLLSPRLQVGALEY